MIVSGQMLHWIARHDEFWRS